jgi:hypothetical protein
LSIAIDGGLNGEFIMAKKGRGSRRALFHRDFPTIRSCG